MHRCCPGEALLQEKLLRQAEAIRLLQELLQSQKEAHLQEMRSVTSSLEAFVAEKQVQEAQINQNTLRLTRKLDNYKQKHTQLNQKIKQQADTIKTLMERKLTLEGEIVKTRDVLQREREKRAEEARYVSELRQVVALRELESNELRKENQRLSLEITYLQREIVSFGEVRQKFANIDTITEEQYQKEISLLKASLQQQLTSTTHDIFSSIVIKDKQSSQSPSKTLIYGSVEEIKIEGEELKKLANFVDYGATYFEIPNEDLKLSDSKRIFQFIASLVAHLRQIERQLQHANTVNEDLNNDLRQKLASFDEQIKQITQKEMTSKETQTGDSGRMQDLQATLNSVKLKNYQLIKIISFLSRFANYAIACSRLEATKTQYFHCAEAALFHPLRHKRKTMRSVGLAVLFVQMLSKGSRRVRRMGGEERLQRQNLQKYVHSSYLANLIHAFSRRERRKVEVKNHKIQQLAQLKPEVNPHQRIIEILNQQNLNQGQVVQDYSSVFSRFIFSTHQRLE